MSKSTWAKLVAPGYPFYRNGLELMSHKQVFKLEHSLSLNLKLLCLLTLALRLLLM